MFNRNTVKKAENFLVSMKDRCWSREKRCRKMRRGGKDSGGKVSGQGAGRKKGSSVGGMSIWGTDGASARGDAWFCTSAKGKITGARFFPKLCSSSGARLLSGWLFDIKRMSRQGLAALPSRTALWLWGFQGTRKNLLKVSISQLFHSWLRKLNAEMTRDKFTQLFQFCVYNLSQTRLEKKRNSCINSKPKNHLAFFKTC